jgi:hypothetical protein
MSILLVAGEHVTGTLDDLLGAALTDALNVSERVAVGVLHVHNGLVACLVERCGHVLANVSNIGEHAATVGRRLGLGGCRRPAGGRFVLVFVGVAEVVALIGALNP